MRGTGDSSIQTASGILFDPLDPDPRLILIEDIAHSLSNQGRFTGHTRGQGLFSRDLYTTAEHSVHVAVLTPEPYKLYGLLHDASEAYLADMSSPVKHHPSMGCYRDAELRLELAICDRFNLPAQMPPEVRTADRYMLGIEARDLMVPAYRDMQHGGMHWFNAVYPVVTHPLSVRRPWSPRKAKREFLRMYHHLLTKGEPCDKLQMALYI